MFPSPLGINFSHSVIVALDGLTLVASCKSTIQIQERLAQFWGLDLSDLADFLAESPLDMRERTQTAEQPCA